MTPADCLFRSARDALDEGDFASALELSRAGLLRDGDHPGLLQVFGLAAYQLNEPLDALEGLEGAGVVSPLSAPSRLALADLYLRFGRREAAASELLFLAEPGRCPTPLMADLARLLGVLGAYRSAFKVCRRLTQLRPWYHPAHYGMAFYLAKLNRPAKAIRHLRAAHALAPTALPYRVALAGALADAGEFAEACDLVRDVPADAIACPEVLKRLQGAAEVDGDVELAVRLRDRLREVADRRPDDGFPCGS